MTITHTDRIGFVTPFVNKKFEISKKYKTKIKKYLKSQFGEYFDDDFDLFVGFDLSVLTPKGEQLDKKDKT